MKPGSPMERNFPSAFPKNPSKLGKVIKEGIKIIGVPGYGAKKVFEAIRNKLKKNNTKTYSATTGELEKKKTTQEVLDNKRKLDYDPQLMGK